MNQGLQALVLAAGRGTRMKSGRPKVLHEIFDWPLVRYPLETLRALGISRPWVVVGWAKDEVLASLNQETRPLLQSPQRGTGHAVQIAEKKLGRFRGDLLIWPADMPLIKKETLKQLLEEHRKSKAAATILSSFVVDPTGYGRILRRGGRVVGIREDGEATSWERGIHEVNTGVYLFRAAPLFEALEKIKPTHLKKEYYLTDTIQFLYEKGARVEAFPFASLEEAEGINSQADLARLTELVRRETIRKLQNQGVTIVAPDQTFIAPDVRMGRDTVIYPWTYIERGVRIGRDCRIGPFAKIRSGTVLEDRAVIGSFVEVVRSRIGKRVFAKHLAYLGDADVGEGTNIGAGTITANFDGKKKNKTKIGKRAFIGVDTLLIAPVRVGDRAQTGAGAVLTRGTRVKAGEVVVGVPARPLRKKNPRRRAQ